MITWGYTVILFKTIQYNEDDDNLFWEMLEIKPIQQ